MAKRNLLVRWPMQSLRQRCTISSIRSTASAMSSFAPGEALVVDEVCLSGRDIDDAKALLPDGDWEGEAGCVPYRVKLDSGCKVLVHRDDHWLVRDLKLQPEGPRQAADGTRCLKRLEKRLVNDGWQAIDHVTRKMQSCDAPDSDDSD